MALVKFESPSTWIISGMTGSGKTTWLYKLLQCKDVIFKDPNKIIYCYSIWTKLFDSMEKDLDMEFVQGAPNAEKIKAIYDGKHHIICLDDLQQEVANSKGATKLFTQLSHHNNLSIIYLNQYLFYQGKCMRTLNLNTDYTILLKKSHEYPTSSVAG